MNGKKVNWIFLASVLLNILTVVLLVVMYPLFGMDIVSNLIVSQLIVLLPAAVGVFVVDSHLVSGSPVGNVLFCQGIGLLL